MMTGLVAWPFISNRLSSPIKEKCGKMNRFSSRNSLLAELVKQCGSSLLQSRAGYQETAP